jgi:hypothetical protein
VCLVAEAANDGLFILLGISMYRVDERGIAFAAAAEKGNIPVIPNSHAPAPDVERQQDFGNPLTLSARNKVQNL